MILFPEKLGEVTILDLISWTFSNISCSFEYSESSTPYSFNAFGAGFDTFNVFLDPSIEKQQENDTFFFFPNESERFIPLLTVGNLQQLVNTDSAVTGPILTGLGLLLHSSGTFSFTFKETGQAFAGVGVINETDNAVSSGLLIDNIRINGILVQGFEDGTIGDISSIGSVSVEGFSGSIAPTQGSKQAFLLAGSTSQEDIESFLRLTPGQLDFNGVVDPTFGSALGAQFNVNAGDTLTYDFDFLDAESAGGKAFNFFKDFCFATKETGIKTIRTTKVFCPYGPIKETV